MATYDPNKNTSEVRGADKHKTNYRVLLISLLLLIVAFAAIFIVYSMMPQGNVIQ